MITNGPNTWTLCGGAGYFSSTHFLDVRYLELKDERLEALLLADTVR